MTALYVRLDSHSGYPSNCPQLPCQSRVGTATERRRHRTAHTTRIHPTHSVSHIS